MKISYQSIRSGFLLSVAILLLSLGLFGWRQSNSASSAPTTERIPLPAECEKTWQQLKISIEKVSPAKVSIVRFTQQVEQYPNLIGFVEITGADKIGAAELRVNLDTANARCYASNSYAIPVDNAEFGRMFQLTLKDIYKEGGPPVYLTLDKNAVSLRYVEDPTATRR